MCFATQVSFLQTPQGKLAETFPNWGWRHFWTCTCIYVSQKQRCQTKLKSWKSSNLFFFMTALRLQRTHHVRPSVRPSVVYGYVFASGGGLRPIVEPVTMGGVFYSKTVWFWQKHSSQGRASHLSQYTCPAWHEARYISKEFRQSSDSNKADTTVNCRGHLNNLYNPS